MKTVYFESDFCVLGFDEDKKLGIGVLKGFLSREQYQEAFQKGATMVREHRLKWFLLDNRQMKAIRQADQAWTLEAFVPGLRMPSLQKLAVIRSADMFNQMAIRSMYANVSHLLPFKAISFNTVSEAMRWLNDETTAVGNKDQASEEAPVKDF